MTHTTAFTDTNSRLGPPDEFLQGMRLRAAAYLPLARHPAVRRSLEKRAASPEDSEQNFPVNTVNGVCAR